MIEPGILYLYMPPPFERRACRCAIGLSGRGCMRRPRARRRRRAASGTRGDGTRDDGGGDGGGSGEGEPPHVADDAVSKILARRFFGGVA